MTALPKNRPSDTGAGQAEASEHAGIRQAGRGMPDKTQQSAGPQVDKQATQHDLSTAASLAMPHERDQQTSMTTEQPAREIKQASSDLKNGLEDTSKGIEMDQTYKKLR